MYSSRYALHLLSARARANTCLSGTNEWIVQATRHTSVSAFRRYQVVGKTFEPKHFLRLKDKPSHFASCVFGTQYRTKLRFKSSMHGTKSNLIKEDLTDPGQCVGVDELTLTQPGLISQRKGNHTLGRIWAWTIFMDYITNYVFVTLMRDLTAESTVVCMVMFHFDSPNCASIFELFLCSHGRFSS